MIVRMEERRSKRENARNGRRWGEIRLRRGSDERYSSEEDDESEEVEEGK